MFLKCSTRRKDGKTHRSWSIVESQRVGRHVVQQHVLYLGEVTDRQRASWERAVSVIDETNGQCRQLTLIPEDRVIGASDGGRRLRQDGDFTGRASNSSRKTRISSRASGDPGQ